MTTAQVGANGKAPAGLKVGDKVVTAGGTYRISGVNSDGTYKSAKEGSVTQTGAGGSRAGEINNPQSKTTPRTTVSSTSSVGSVGAKTVQVGADGKAPKGLKTGDLVITAGGTYRIDGVNPDGTYKSTNTTPKAPAPGGVVEQPYVLEEPIPTLKPQPNNILGTSNQVLDRYTLEQLLALFQPGVEASYNVQENEAKKMMGVFDQGMFNLGNAGLENVKRGMGTATTGMASKSATGAQALSSILGTYMDAAGAFTGLQQDMQGITDKKAQALEQLVPTAMAAKNTQDSNFANLFNSLYAADTQYGVGALDYLGNKYNADKNLEGVAAQAMANVTASKNSSASSSSGAYNPNSSYDKYVSAMSTAVAEGNRTAFMNAAAGMGYSPKEAEDWWALSNKTDKIATTTGGTTMAERTAALKQMMEENAAKQGKMFVTDPNGVTHFQPRT